MASQYILVASGWGSYAAILMPALLPQLEKVPAASTLIASRFRSSYQLGRLKRAAPILTESKRCGISRR